MIEPTDRLPTFCELRKTSEKILRDQFSLTKLPDDSSRWVPTDYSSEFMVEQVAKASDAYIGDQHTIGMIVATLKSISNGCNGSYELNSSARHTILNFILDMGDHTDIVTLTKWAISSDVRLQMIAREHKYENEELRDFLRRCRDLETKIIVQATLDALEDYIIINR
tara:strand:- start:14 stop:514 length:501 start_codon:yes stop_codon:yes gene_type:complete